MRRISRPTGKPLYECPRCGAKYPLHRTCPRCVIVLQQSIPTHPMRAA